MGEAACKLREKVVTDMKQKEKKQQNAAVKRSMYELFGVGSGEVEESQPAPAAVPAKAAIVPPAPQPVPALVKKTSPASLLAEGTTFEGTLCAKGDVEIAGGFKGSITTEGAVCLRSDIESSVTAESVKLVDCVLNGDITAKETVDLNENAKVVGNVTAASVLCAGTITGDLTAEKCVHLEKKSRVNGSITTAALSVEEGAVITGNVQIKPAAKDNK